MEHDVFQKSKPYSMHIMLAIILLLLGLSLPPKVLKVLVVKHRHGIYDDELRVTAVENDIDIPRVIIIVRVKRMTMIITKAVIRNKVVERDERKWKISPCRTMLGGKPNRKPPMFHWI